MAVVFGRPVFGDVFEVHGVLLLLRNCQDDFFFCAPLHDWTSSESWWQAENEKNSRVAGLLLNEDTCSCHVSRVELRARFFQVNRHLGTARNKNKNEIAVRLARRSATALAHCQDQQCSCCFAWAPQNGQRCPCPIAFPTTDPFHETDVVP